MHSRTPHTLHKRLTPGSRPGPPSGGGAYLLDKGAQAVNTGRGDKHRSANASGHRRSHNPQPGGTTNLPRCKLHQITTARLAASNATKPLGARMGFHSKPLAGHEAPLNTKCPDIPIVSLLRSVPDVPSGTLLLAPSPARLGRSSRSHRVLSACRSPCMC